MSGIFKSIKKVFKKVGKVIKKIAPYLIIAAGVYFGGSYLMSIYGGATSAAAGSAATSFTKSAGVWKSFLSGLTNGTAAQSAAAFAEGSYQASIGLNALPLSGQVLAGTSSVNALNGVLSTQQAVTAGVDLAKGAWVQSGGDAQAMTNIVQKAWSQSQAINAGNLSVDAAGSSAVSTADSLYDESYGMGQLASHPGQAGHIPGLEGTFTTPEAQRIYALGSDGGATKGFDASKMVGDVSHPSGVDYSQQGGVITAAQQGGGTQLQAGGSNQGYLKYLDAALAQNKASNDRMYAFMENAAAKREEASKRQLMWSMAQTGLKAVGGYMTAKSEEEYRDRPRNWKRKEDEPMWDPWSGEKRKGIII